MSVYSFNIDPSQSESIFKNPYRRQGADVRKHIASNVQSHLESLYKNNVGYIETVENMTNPSVDLTQTFRSFNNFDKIMNTDGATFHTFDTETLPLLDKITEVSVVDHQVSFVDGKRIITNMDEASIAFGVDSDDYLTLKGFLNRAKEQPWDTLTQSEKATVERLTLLSGGINERFRDMILPDGTIAKAITSYNDVDKTSIQLAMQGLENQRFLGEMGQTQKGDVGTKILANLSVKLNNILAKEDAMLTGHNTTAFDIPKMQKLFGGVNLDFNMLEDKHFDLLPYLKAMFDGDEEKLTQFLAQTSGMDPEVVAGLKTMDQFRHVSKASKENAHMAVADNKFFAELLNLSGEDGQTFFEYLKEKGGERAGKLDRYLPGDKIVGTKSIKGGLLDFYVDANGEVKDYLSWPASRNQVYTLEGISELTQDEIFEMLLKSSGSEEEARKMMKKVTDTYKIDANAPIVMTALKDDRGGTSYIFRNKKNPYVDAMNGETDESIESMSKLFQNHFANVSNMDDVQIAELNRIAREDKARRAFEGFFQPSNIDINGGFEEADRMYKTFDAFGEYRTNNGLSMTIGETIDHLRKTDKETYNSIASNLSKSATGSVSESVEEKFYMLRNVLEDTRSTFGESIDMINEAVDNANLGFSAHKMNLYKTQALKQQHERAIKSASDFYSKHSLVQIGEDVLEVTPNVANKIASNRVGGSFAYNELNSIAIPNPIGDGVTRINMSDKSSINKSLYSIYYQNAGNYGQNSGSKYMNLKDMVNGLKQSEVPVLPQDFEINPKITIHENITRLGKQVQETVASQPENEVKSLIKANNFKFGLGGYSTFEPDGNGILVESNRGSIQYFKPNRDNIMKDLIELQEDFQHIFTPRNEFVYNAKGFAPALPDDMRNFLRTNAGWSDDAMNSLSKGLFNKVSRNGPMGWLTRKGPNGENNLTMGMFINDDGRLFMAFGDKDKDVKNLYDVIINKDPSRANKRVGVMEMPTVSNINGAEVVSYKGYKKQNVKKVGSYINSNGVVMTKGDSVSEAVGSLFSHSISRQKKRTALDKMMDGDGEGAKKLIDKHVIQSLESSPDIKGRATILSNGKYIEAVMPNAVDAQGVIDFDEFVINGIKDIASKEETPEQFKPFFDKLESLDTEGRMLSRDNIKKMTKAELEDITSTTDHRFNLAQKSYIYENLLMDTETPDVDAQRNGLVQKLFNYYSENGANTDEDVLNELGALIDDPELSQGQSGSLTAKARVSQGHLGEYQPFGYLTDQSRQGARAHAEGSMLLVSDLQDFEKDHRAKNKEQFIYTDKVIRTDKEKEFLARASEKVNAEEMGKLYPGADFSKGQTNSISVVTRQMNDEQINKSLKSFKENVIDRINAGESVEQAKDILRKAGASVQGELTDENIAMLNRMFEKLSITSSTYEQSKFGVTEMVDPRLFGKPELNKEKIVNELTEEQQRSFIGKFFDAGDRIALDGIDSGANNTSYAGHVVDIVDGKLVMNPVENPKLTLNGRNFDGTVINLNGESVEIGNMANKDIEDNIKSLMRKINDPDIEDSLDDRKALNTLISEEVQRKELIGKELRPGDTVDINGRTISFDDLTGELDDRIINKGIRIQNLDGNSIEGISLMNSRYMTAVKVNANGAEKGMLFTHKTGDALEEAVGDVMFQEMFGDGQNIALVSNDNVYKHGAKGLMASSNAEKIIRTNQDDARTFVNVLRERLGADHISDTDDGILTLIGNPERAERYDEILTGIFDEFESGEVSVGGEQVAVSKETSDFLKRKDISILNISKSTMSEKKSAAGDHSRPGQKGAKFASRDYQINALNINPEDVTQWEEVRKANESINEFLMSDSVQDLSDYIDRSTLKSDKAENAIKTIGALNMGIAESGDLTPEDIEASKILNKSLTVSELSIDEAAKLSARGDISFDDRNLTLFSDDYGDVLKIDLGDISINKPLPAMHDSVNQATNVIYVPNLPIAKMGDDTQYNEIQNKAMRLIDNIDAYRNNKFSKKEAEESLSYLTQDLYSQYTKELTKKGGLYEALSTKRLPNSGSSLLNIVNPDFTVKTVDGESHTGLENILDVLTNRQNDIDSISHNNPTWDEVFQKTNIIEKTDQGFIFRDAQVTSLKNLEDRGIDLPYASRRAMQDAERTPDVLKKMGVGSIDELAGLSESERGLRYLENVGVRGEGWRHPNFMETSVNKMMTFLDRRLDGNVTYIMPWTGKKTNADVDGDTFYDWMNKVARMDKHIDTVVDAEGKRNIGFFADAVKDANKLGTVEVDYSAMRVYGLSKIAERDITDSDLITTQILGEIHNLSESDKESILFDNKTVGNVSREHLEEGLKIVDDTYVKKGHKISSRDSMRGAIQADVKKKLGVGYASIPNLKLRDVGLANVMDGTAHGEQLLKNLATFTAITEENIISSKHLGFSEEAHWADIYSSTINKITSMNANADDVEDGFSTLTNILLESTGDETQTNEMVESLREIFHGENGSANREQFNKLELQTRKILKHEDYKEFTHLLAHGGDDSVRGTGTSMLNEASRKINARRDVNIEADKLYTDGNDFLSPSRNYISTTEDGLIKAEFSIQGLRPNSEGNDLVRFNTGETRTLYGSNYTDIQEQIHNMGIRDTETNVKAHRGAVNEGYARLNKANTTDDVLSLNRLLNSTPKSRFDHQHWMQEGFREKAHLEAMSEFATNLDDLQNAGQITKDQSNSMITDMNQRIKERAKSAKHQKAKRDVIQNHLEADKISVLNKHANVTISGTGGFDGYMERAMQNKSNHMGMLMDEFKSINNVDVIKARDILSQQNRAEIERLQSKPQEVLDSVGGIESIQKHMNRVNIDDNLEIVKGLNQKNLARKDDIMNTLVNNAGTDNDIKSFLNWQNYDDLASQSVADLDSLDDMLMTYGDNIGKSFRDLTMDDITEVLKQSTSSVEEHQVGRLLDMQNKLNLYVGHKEANDALGDIAMSMRSIPDVDLGPLKLNITTADEAISKVGKEVAEQIAENSTRTIEDNIDEVITKTSKTLTGKKGILAGVGLGVAAYLIGSNINGSSKPLTPERTNGGHRGQTPRVDGNYDGANRRTSNSSFRKSVYTERPQEQGGLNVSVRGKAPGGFNQHTASILASSSGLSGNVNVSMQDDRQSVSDDWLERELSNLI